MADLINTAPRDIPTSSALPIAVLSVLTAMGTLATNILLPSLPHIAISLNVTSAAVTSAITVFLAVFGLGQLLVGPLSDRYGRRWPVLIGFAVFFAGSVWCGLATDLPNLLAGRVVQATGACATAVLSRAIARDMFSGAALARAMALIMIVMSAAAGFSPLLGGALDHSLGWRAEFALVAAFAAVSAVAYGIVLGETHNSIRTPLNPVDIGRTYAGLIGDRRFIIPATTSSLIIGGMFSMFSAAPRLFIEALHFTPIQVGLFFVGTAFIVAAAGMLATKLAPRYGLDGPIRAGLCATAASNLAILLISMTSPTFLPFLGAICVFLLGAVLSFHWPLRGRFLHSGRRPAPPRRCWVSCR
jgi:DHA1 family bicyclomycin/chloramphenicol resistance-like MFS transporter